MARADHLAPSEVLGRCVAHTHHGYQEGLCRAQATHVAHAGLSPAMVSATTRETPEKYVHSESFARFSAYSLRCVCASEYRYVDVIARENPAGTDTRRNRSREHRARGPVDVRPGVARCGCATPDAVRIRWSLRNTAFQAKRT